MCRVLTAFVAMSCLLLAVAEFSAAQQPNTVAVGFRNQTNSNILVQGYTIINKTQRPGQILQLKKSGGMAFDNNVPLGIRYVNIYDANNPTVILLRDFPVAIQKRDAFFDIVPMSPTNPKLMLVPATMPAPSP
jgi:hypothetical protein